MGIISAAIAFLEALDGPRSGPGRAPAEPGVAPVQAPPPLGLHVEALQTRVADLEAQLKTIKPYVDEEVERARRHVEGLRSTVRRLKEFVEGSGEQLDAGADVPGGDVPASGGQQLLAVHGGMEAAPPPSPEAIRAAARRAVALS